MRSKARVLVAGAVLVAWAAPSRASDTITLTNGRVIVADRAWFEGTQLFYEKSGAQFGLPRDLVRSVQANASSPPPPSQDPDVQRGLEYVKAGRDTEAVALLRGALAREPRDLAALVGLTEALLRLQDSRAAAEAAERAIRLDPRDPRPHELLGDALLALGNTEAASGAYRASLRLRADPQVQKKLDVLPPTVAKAAAGPQFRLRYDGGVNEPLGLAVLRILGDAFSEFAQRIGYVPPDPVTVVLETQTDFEAAGAPPWAEGVFDGTVRIPVRGVEQPDRRLRGVLRHELAHSFVTLRTGGNCPTWIQEGVAQWLEGDDPARADAGLAARARSGTLFPLLTLEAPFQNLAPSDVPVAYAESLSGLAHLLRLRGEPGLTRLLSALGDGLPSEEALPVAIGMSYPEFQKNWELYLRGRR